MNINKTIQALQDHAKEEIRIHKEIFSEASTEVKEIAQKHLDETISIHKTFWKKLKKAIKGK